MKWAVVQKKERDFEDTLREREQKQALKGLLWKAVVQGAGLSVLALLTAFQKLGHVTTEDKELQSAISRAMDAIQENAWRGIQLLKRLIPRKYKTYGAENLRKINLPNGWRLIYFIGKNEAVTVSTILEWLDHKNYERRFKY